MFRRTPADLHPLFRILLMVSALGLEGGWLSAPCSGSPTTGASAPKVLENPVAVGDGTQTLRVFSLNLNAVLSDRAARIDRTLQLILEQRPDVLLFQELSEGWIFGENPLPRIAAMLEEKSSKKADSGVELEANSKWHFQSFWTDSFFLGGMKYGLGIVSRFPILEPEFTFFQDLPLKLYGYDKKGYVTFKIPFKGAGSEFIRVINVHFTSTENVELRNRQWEQMSAHLKNLLRTGPVLLAGDFNLFPEDPIFQRVARSFQMITVFGAPTDLPQKKLKSWTPKIETGCQKGSGHVDVGLLDYLVWVPSQSKEHLLPTPELRGGLLDPAPPFPSDHCPVTAELRWPQLLGFPLNVAPK